VIEYYLATTKQLRPSVDHTVPALAIGQARLISDQWQTDRSLSDPLLAHNGLLERALHMSALGGKVDPSFAARPWGAGVKGRLNVWLVLSVFAVLENRPLCLLSCG
jgi:hypothetical protein